MTTLAPMIPWQPCFLFLQEADEAFSFVQAGRELFGFLSYFAIFGALGFHLFVLRRMTGLRPTDGAFRAADRRAAFVGLVGAIFFLINLAVSVADNRQHLPFLDALQHGGPSLFTTLACGVVLFLAFALSRVPGFWLLGGLAGLVLALRNITSGRWASLVNPLHEVAASLWIGTLFVLVVAGLPALLRGPVETGRRGPLVAELVARFSNLALGAAALLGVTGVITAWRHLKYWAALWTTSYGYAFDAKMLVVLLVAGLGAWNWKRMRPQLGTESSGFRLQRSAAAELAFAAVVLVITAVLVSLPAPKLPGS
ncbi:MAG TPA: CopD family protein [Thermoanaerobaculia bacterium]